VPCTQRAEGPVTNGERGDAAEGRRWGREELLLLRQGTQGGKRPASSTSLVCCVEGASGGRRWEKRQQVGGARLRDFLDAMAGSLTARASPAPWIQGAAARWRGRAGRCSVREEEEAGAGAGATAPWLAERRSRPGRHGRKGAELPACWLHAT
jgi:hypothetical protein